MNVLFWTILLTLLTIGGAHAWVKSRRSSTSTTADNLSFTHRSDWPLRADECSLGDVQFIATSDRIRAAVTIEVTASDADRRRSTLEILAHEVYRRTEVEAVFVQAHRPGQRPDLYLFAADGRGWWGRELVSNAIDGADLEAETRR